MMQPLEDAKEDDIDLQEVDREEEEEDSSSSSEEEQEEVEEEDTSSSEEEDSDDEEEEEDENTAFALDERKKRALLEHGWAMYMDEKSGYPYYFNHNTGESQWNQPSLSQPKVQQRRGPTVARSTAIQPYQAQDDEGSKPFVKEKTFAALSEDSDEDEDENEEDPDRIDTDEQAESAVRFYIFSSVFHILFIEGPLAAFEGLFYGMFKAAISVAMFLYASLQRSEKDKEYYRTQLGAAAELMAAGCTLILPGSVLFAYRDMIRAYRDGRLSKSAKVDDWVVGKIPTILGKVDARKLRMIATGQGSYAVNVRSLRQQLYL